MSYCTNPILDKFSLQDSSLLSQTKMPPSHRELVLERYLNWVEKEECFISLKEKVTIIKTNFTCNLRVYGLINY